MSAAQEEFKELMRDKERTTTHPEDRHDDARSFLNLSDDSDGDTTPPASSVERSRTPVSTARSTIPTKRYGANTGPKGVISDAQNFQDSRRLQRASMRSVSTLTTQSQSLSVHQPAPGEKIEEDDELDLDDDEDDSFMKKWRRNRVKEMQNGVKGSQMHRNGNTTRLFGSLTMVDPAGYLDAVEKSGPDVVVVVFIFDDYSEVSDLCEQCVRKLASRHQDTRFIKLHYADAQMEPMGVPAIIAYRNGDKFAGLVPLINELPDDSELNAVTLENVFKRHQILS
ncbi:hypothetical protein CERZMDRAFT_104660 [Cercospora zeae-maydis SCOH1-5]|uniref:Phosducin domain-containing protein n=1 Tax=Cercospora zeae-maydis SCOH1-5 TaxID=717836 RepID=A0A6A6FRW2_9PEZI|nr:hypothetical protein CERZMDRAFT_104660 [Cercospora zeae-maydis SCOH1-5]